MTKIRNSICFAYYGDNTFLGWHADSFGSIRENSPKIYGDSKRQLEIIKGNFTHKVKNAKLANIKENYSKKYFALGPEAVMKLMVGSQMSDYEKINAFKVIELRIVQCPFLTGPDPEFSKKVDKDFRKIHTRLYHKWCKEFGLDPGIKPNSNWGIALIDNYKRFNKIYPAMNSKNWVYPNYDEVKRWATGAPKESTEFVKIKL